MALLNIAYKFKSSPDDNCIQIPQKTKPFAHLYKASLMWSEKVNTLELFILPLERGAWSFSPNWGWWISCYIPRNRTIFGGSSLGLLGNLISGIQFPVTWLELRTSPRSPPPAKDKPSEKPNMTTIFGWGRGFLKREEAWPAQVMAFLGPWIDERGGANQWKILGRREIKSKWQVTQMHVIIRHLMYFVLHIKLEIFLTI